MSNNNLSPPSHSDEVKISFPKEHVVLLAMNRPKSLNAMWHVMEGDLEKLLNWFEGESSLWFVLDILAGERPFTVVKGGDYHGPWPSILCRCRSESVHDLLG